MLINLSMRLDTKRDLWLPGLLVLDIAERRRYWPAVEVALPADEWLCVTFANRVDHTAVWMRCPQSTDAHCRQAAAELRALKAAYNGTITRFSPTVC